MSSPEEVVKERSLDDYVSVRITRKGGKIQYNVLGTELSEEEKKLREYSMETLNYTLDVNVNEIEGEDQRRRYLRSRFIRCIKNNKRLRVGKPTIERVFSSLVRDHLGYGLIDPLMKDPDIEDIHCSGVRKPIFITHKEFGNIPTNLSYYDPDTVDSFANRLAYLSGRHISIATPRLDAMLPNKSRLQMSLGEVAASGTHFTIRKFKKDPYTIIDLINFKTLSPEIAAHLWYCLENKGSLLVVGPTASGKTSTLNAISMLLHPDSKIVSIEDTPELNLPHENWIQSVTRSGYAGMGEVTLFELLKDSLRQRPDYIIVGEVRGKEAQTLFQAITTGHAGLSTLHADKYEDALRRLYSEPINIAKIQLAALDYIVFQQTMKTPSGLIRRVTDVAEIKDYERETDSFGINLLFTYSPKEDTFIYHGQSHNLEEIKKKVTVDPKEEVDLRTKLLKYLVEKGIRDYLKFSDIIREFYGDRDSLLTKLNL